MSNRRRESTSPHQSTINRLVDGFMRGGFDDPDFIAADCELERIVRAERPIWNCKFCGGSIRGAYNRLKKFCSPTCAQASSNKVNHDENWIDRRTRAYRTAREA